MSKSNDNISKFFLKLLLIIASFVMLYVFVLTENKQLNKMIINEMDNIAQNQNIINNLMVEYQNYSSEERIVDYARTNLGMVRNNEYIFNVKINKEQLIELNKLIDKRYE